jgi:beta-glucosidase
VTDHRGRRHRRGIPVVVAALVLSFAACGTGVTAPSSARCPWVGSSAAVSRRVRDVMKRMTRAERLTMVHGTVTGIVTEPGYAGSVAGVPRLCIPPLHLADGPGGVGDLISGVTQLPAPVALAATWDPGLARRYGAVVGAEARGKGIGVALAPTVNIVRDPRWGRAFESLGEDPYLTSTIATPVIEGIQSQRVIAQVKHLAAYNQETNRDTAADDAIVDERALREIYLPAFDAAVHRAHVGSVMCAYSTVNGVPACANQVLLTDVLKREWRFPGFVTSDWYADLPGTSAAAAGLDMQMPDNCMFGPALDAAITAGRVSGARLDDMVRRILTVMFATGIVDHPSRGTIGDDVRTAAHRTLAREVAAEGTVLLRNEHALLPFDPTRVRSIAVVGAAGADSFHVGGGSATVLSNEVVSPLQGIQERAGASVRVTSSLGTDPGRAAALAASADVAVVMVGRADAESHDHTALDLDRAANRLVDAVAAANPNTVVVLDTGSAVVTPWLDRVGAVLEAWYPGQEDGHALAAVLFGDVNPSGKLPVTFPASLADVPAATAAQWPGTTGNGVAYSEGLQVGYRGYDARDVTPQFAFGSGLSYTTFAFRRLQVTRSTSTGRVKVGVDVTNTGGRAGADVVQLYVGYPSSAGEPPRQLRAFRRIRLAPGHRARVNLQLDASALSHWDSRRRRSTASAGDYEIFVGDASNHLPVHATTRLTRTRPGTRAPSPSAPPAAAGGDASDRQRCPADGAFAMANGVLSTPVTP